MSEISEHAERVLLPLSRNNARPKLAFRPRVAENRATRLSVEIFVEMQPDFEYSTGQTIDRPWLCLQALPPDHLRIGLGEMKCRAICAVEKDLEVWLTGL